MSAYADCPGSLANCVDELQVDESIAKAEVVRRSGLACSRRNLVGGRRGLGLRGGCREHLEQRGRREVLVRLWSALLAGRRVMTIAGLVITVK
jgi:hypothetical protein